MQALGIPGYGLELMDRVRRLTGGLVRLRMGSVYPALKALEEQELVRGEVVPPRGSAGRPRKYYELTAAGMAAALAEREALAALLRTKDSGAGGEDLRRMQERLRRAGRASASVRRLRERMLALEETR